MSRNSGAWISHFRAWKNQSVRIQSFTTGPMSIEPCKITPVKWRSRTQSKRRRNPGKKETPDITRGKRSAWERWILRRTHLIKKMPRMRNRIPLITSNISTKSISFRNLRKRMTLWENKFRIWITGKRSRCRSFWAKQGSIETKYRQETYLTIKDLERNLLGKDQ